MQTRITNDHDKAEYENQAVNDVSVSNVRSRNLPSFRA